jgi:hypothetical protein
VNAGVVAQRSREGYRTGREGVVRGGRAGAAPRVVGRDGDDRTYRTGGGMSRALERPEARTRVGGVQQQPQQRQQAQRAQPQRQQAPAERNARPTERRGGGMSQSLERGRTAQRPPEASATQPNAAPSAQPPRRLGTIERATPQRAPGGQARAAERYRAAPGATAERYRAPGNTAERSRTAPSTAERYRVPDSTAQQRYGGGGRAAQQSRAPEASRQSAPAPRANPAARSSERAAGNGRSSGRGQQNQPLRGERGQAR